MNPVVIDAGSCICKVGFAGEEIPNAVIPSLIGHLPNDSKRLIGKEAFDNREDCEISYPIRGTKITNWDHFESLLDHCYKQVSADPKEQSLLLTEPHCNPKKNQEKTTEILFEKFGIPALHIASQTVLSLYAANRTTGIVLDIGDHTCSIVPIYHGYVDQAAVQCLDYSGKDLTDFLQMLLLQGKSVPVRSDWEDLRELKENFCYVAIDFEKEENGPRDVRKLELPGGRSVNVSSEDYTCPEALFKPSLIGLESEGIHKALRTSVMKCDYDLRKELYGNIVLSGGTTKMKGFVDRLEREIVQLVPPQVQIKLIKQADRHHASWIGGSVLASLISFKDYCITKQQFEEQGTGIIYKNVFL
ncbi:actin-like [Agrilus planipennis]|uniref:Actin-like n=1 Tax=Agrilus planipennis TaxID=224129 RepID=A0A1W4X5Q4_AGRPL|nr:actin-like [Agrilus planipennis]